MSNAAIQFDGQSFFHNGRHIVQPLSWRRDSIDRGFGGLDGVVSVDLGLRKRKLKQRGFLSALSVPALMQLIDDISAYIDGQCHTLVDQHGVSYSNARMDHFSLVGPIAVGNQVQGEYEIIYTQLGN